MRNSLRHPFYRGCFLPRPIRLKMQTLIWAIGIVFLVGCTEEDDQKAGNATVSPLDRVHVAKIVEAKPASASAKRVFPGTIEASKKSDLAFRVSGQLKTLEAMPGKYFKRGEVLASLDDAEFVNQLAERRATYQLAQSQFTKIKKLVKQKFTSQTDLDEAEAQLKTAEAALAIARDNLKYTKLRAPFDGQVALVNVDNFQSVAANQVIMQFHNRDTLDVRFSVPESLFARVKPLEDPSSFCLNVVFNAYPEKKYPACFKEFESVPDSVTRSYQAVHTMPRVEDFLVLPGMAVNVEVDLTRLLIDDSRYLSLVPIEAVFQRDGQARVWKVKDSGEVTEVVVVTGPIHDQYIFIKEGLNAGELVVAAGVSYLQEGMKVKPIAKERGL